MPVPTNLTPNDLITSALKLANVIGVGQTPLSELMNDSFRLLNMMLGQWNRKRWLIYHLVDLPFGATGALNYTIGPGGDIAYPYRPDRLEGAFFRYVQRGVSAGLRDFSRDYNADFGPQTPQDPDATAGIDYPLMLVQSREDWSAIGYKTLGQGGNGFPQAIFYDAAFPLAKVYVWPVPTSPFEIHLLIKEEIAQLASLTTAVALPNEYQEAIVYNLALRIFAQNGGMANEDVRGIARAALNTIRNANAQVPLLSLPAAIERGGRYSIYSDTFR